MDIQSKVTDVETKVVQGVSSLKSEANADIQHFMSYLKVVHAGWILALVLLVAGGGFLVHRGITSYEIALDKANEANKVLVADLKETAQKWSDGQQKIAASQARTVVIEKQVAANDSHTANQIAQVTRPDETITQVQSDAGHFLGEVPSTTPDFKLAFKVPTVQGFVANKIELDGTKVDLGLRTEELAEANKQRDIYADNLKQTQDTLQQSVTTVNDYKKAAVKSKWKAVGRFAITAGIVVGTGAAAYALGTNSK